MTNACNGASGRVCFEVNAFRAGSLIRVMRPLHTMKTLPKVWSNFLLTKGETGMGYQVVAITLRDGRRFEDVAIIESNIIGEVRGHEDIPFEPKEIVSMELTHRRWQFRR